MPHINAVLFDYGLVLTGPPAPISWARMKLLLKASEADFHAAYWKHRDAYDRGSLTGVAYWHHVAADIGQTLDTDHLQQLLDADTGVWTQPNQPMIDWATTLQRAGRKTGILSNIGDAMEIGVLAHCGWLADFTHHTFSHRVKLAKPDPAIYAHAITGLAVPASEILFIDDREDNIAAARAVGMQAVQYTHHDAFLDAMREAGFGYLLNL